MTVRTRFAPSPTGYLHIGGVRTAYFNYLLAKQAGGQFILRIDDTDQVRNVDEALQPILEGFKWLGIAWDEGPEVGGPYGPYFQSQRLERYQQEVQRMLANGTAYRDYARPEELQSQREAAEKAGVAFVYDRSWMAETDEQAAAFEKEGRSAVVRLKIPREGACRFHDLIRDEVHSIGARSRTTSFNAMTGLASIIWPVSSMTSTSESRMSSELSSICRIRLDKSLLRRVSATPCHNMPISLRCRARRYG